MSTLHAPSGVLSALLVPLLLTCQTFPVIAVVLQETGTEAPQTYPGVEGRGWLLNDGYHLGYAWEASSSPQFGRQHCKGACCLVIFVALVVRLVAVPHTPGGAGNSSCRGPARGLGYHRVHNCPCGGP